METYQEYKSALKPFVQIDKSSPAGIWKRYAVGDIAELQEYVAQLCYLYLKGDERARQWEADLVADGDNDVLWFLQTFLEEQMSKLQKSNDSELLLLGLTAVAILGDASDPRDIGLWSWELYKIAKNIGLDNPGQYFLLVSKLASRKVRGYSWGTASVAEQIRTVPESFEKWNEEQEKNNESEDSEYENYKHGWTPLMYAALKGQLPRIFTLLKEGADIEATDDGMSALALAAFAGKQHAVEMLLNAGARVDIRPQNRSLIDFAIFHRCDEKIVARLRRAGAV